MTKNHVFMRTLGFYLVLSFRYLFCYFKGQKEAEQGGLPVDIDLACEGLLLSSLESDEEAKGPDLLLAFFCFFFFLFFLLSPTSKSFPSLPTCFTFISFKLAGSTQLQRKPLQFIKKKVINAPLKIGRDIVLVRKFGFYLSEQDG